MVSELPDPLQRLQAAGYWRVLIRPTQYREDRIPTLSACRQTLEDSVVRLRGWDYPHIDHEHTQNRQSWMESSVDWLHGHIEYWRFYQSGQFIHYFAMREDYEDSSRNIKGLDFVNTIYTFTEIFEFAARLAARGVLSPSAEVSAHLHGCDGRRIFSWDRGRYLREYMSTEPVIRFSETLPESTLLSEAASFAVRATVFVFERFNWTEAPEGLLVEEQAKLLERRL